MTDRIYPVERAPAAVPVAGRLPPPVVSHRRSSPTADRSDLLAPAMCGSSVRDITFHYNCLCQSH